MNDSVKPVVNSAVHADAHHHYDHYSTEMAERLDGFYGQVDKRINASIDSYVVGESVLDVGCGFGSLTELMRFNGRIAVGIDLLENCVIEGKRRFPLADLRFVKSEDLDFPDKSFDTVVLKDVIHHVYEEDDISEFLKGVKRIARKRLVILDPNPMVLLLLARKVIGHIDPVCAPTDAMRVLEEEGFKVSRIEYSDVLAFPLSGGYVGPVLVPARPKFVGDFVLFIDQTIFKLVRFLKLEKHISWRYLLVAEI